MSWRIRVGGGQQKTFFKSSDYSETSILFNWIWMLEPVYLMCLSFKLIFDEIMIITEVLSENVVEDTKGGGQKYFLRYLR